MRSGLVLLVMLSTAWASPADSRPGAGARPAPIFEALDLSGEWSDLVPSGPAAVFQSAQGGTTWFGGTVWAADSMRWEAIEGGVWTFDSGVGSSIVPPGGPGDLSAPTRDWIDPFKAPGLHATLEGWIGFDVTYSAPPYFRRLSSADALWSGGICVGTPAGLQGSYSFWCGVFRGEADALCFSEGQGYGNSWVVCIEHPFTYDGAGYVNLSFSYKNETELHFDYAIVYVDTSGAGEVVEVTSFTGTFSGTESLPLAPGGQLPVSGGPIKIKFCVESDGAWSDEDGLNPTTCGAFAVDNVTVSGGGIAHSANFETDAGGWVLSVARPGPGGDWANLYDISDLPPMTTSCPCGLADTVLAFPDESNGHPRRADNLAVSPWIDLKAAGLVGTPGKILKTHLYAHLPLLNYVFAQFAAQWYPEMCFSTGKLITSPWISYGFWHYFGGIPVCTSPTNALGMQLDFSTVVPPGSEQVRVAIGVVNYCGFYGECFGGSNTTPWFDEVAFGVYGTPNAPYISSEEMGLPQDTFPENGTLNLSAPGRVDCNDIQGASQPEIGTTLGDTLVVRGGAGNAEVYVHFRVTPGPGTNATAFNNWWNRQANSTVQGGFKMARCDTAERGFTGPINGNWMTSYHEADPNFSGADRDIDGADVAPNGGTWRLANDIFPDDLFTMGTRIDIFYTANHVGNPGSYYKTPLGAGVYHEMEILPSSADAALPTEWNCVLYVDHFGRGGQGYIEAALTEILGTGSENFEETNWDRFDVNAATSRQMSFGRPIHTEYGASVYQALGYMVILWHTGNLNGFTLTKEDADVLNPWLTIIDLDFHNLYLSGDGLVYGVVTQGDSEPSARRLIEELAGVGLQVSCANGTYRNANCPSLGAPVDLTPCVDLLPVEGAVVAGSGGGRSVGHQGQGNGCPDMRSFDVLAVSPPEYGVALGDEEYSSAAKSAQFASTATDAAPGGVLNYKIVVDGLSVHYRRDSGGQCDYELGSRVAVRERLEEVLSYFGYAEAYFCQDFQVPVALADKNPDPPIFRTALTGTYPNPTVSGSPSRIRFSLVRESSATLRVYDLRGSLVKTIFDGIGKEGENEAVWNGTDDSGTPVASGVYFYWLRAGGEEQGGRIVVLARGAE